MEYQISQYDNVSDNLNNLLQRTLEDRNVNIDDYVKKPFSFELKIDNEIVAGITGYSVWDWLYVELIAVDKKFQGNGYGLTLLNKAENEAKIRGCYGIWLNTMSFQAPDFYLKSGYSVFGEMEECPKGHKRIFFQKYISE